jgi:hypothetical protein
MNMTPRNGKEVGAPQKAPTPTADSLPVLNSNGHCNAETVSWRDRLRELSERIVNNEGDSIHARWEFGKTLLEHRQGNKQLPNGLLAEVVKTHKISKREVGYRMQFAEKFATETEVCNALQTHKSWRRIVSKALPATPPPKPDFVKRFNYQLLKLEKAAQNLEGLCKDKEFARHVDALRREHRDDGGRLGIHWGYEVVIRAITRAHDDLTAEQLTLLDSPGGGE